MAVGEKYVGEERARAWQSLLDDIHKFNLSRPLQICRAVSISFTAICVLIIQSEANALNIGNRRRFKEFHCVGEKQN